MQTLSCPYDRAWVLAQIGEDEALLDDITQIFLEDAHALRHALQEACAQQDWHALAEAAHTTKSAVGNFGAHAAFAAARDLELDARAGAAGRLAEGLDALLAQLDALEAALRADLSA